MAMAAGCSICSDSLFKTFRPDPEPGQPVVILPNNVNAMVTSCGHAYHAYCITRWMTGGLANSASCPNCRKSIPNKKCTPLFLDTYDVTLNESSFSPADLGAGDVDELRRELAISMQNYEDCKTQRDSYKDQVKEFGDTMQALSNENATLLEQLENEKEKSDRFMLKYQQAESYKSFAEQKDSQLKKAENELKKLTYVREVLNGVKYETESDLKAFPPNQNSVTTLIQVKQALTQELDALKERNMKEKEDREAYRMEKLNMLKTISRLQKEKEDMELVIRGNPQVRLTTLPVPAPTCPKDQDEPAAKKSKTGQNGTIILSSDEEEDKDVGLFKRFGGLRRNVSKAAPRVPKPAVRSSSVSTRVKAPKANSDVLSEPLSPMNLRCKSGIPGLGNVMVTKKLSGTAAATKGTTGMSKRSETVTWKR